MTVWNGTGYLSCFDPKVPYTPAQKLKMAKTCWENWPAEEFLQYIQRQGGRGGFVHATDSNMVGDGPCGQLGMDGDMFTDPSQRPAAFVAHLDHVINATRAANRLLPTGAPHHPVTVYVDTYISTGANDSTLFADSAILREDGVHQVYTNCTKPGGKITTQSPMFYADGQNKFSTVMDQYFELAFALGGDSIYHVRGAAHTRMRALSS